MPPKKASQKKSPVEAPAVVDPLPRKKALKRKASKTGETEGEKAPKNRAAKPEESVESGGKKAPNRRAPKPEESLENGGKKAPNRRAPKPEESLENGGKKALNRRAPKPEESLESGGKKAPNRRAGKADKPVVTKEENVTNKKAAKPSTKTTAKAVEAVETEEEQAPPKKAPKNATATNWESIDFSCSVKSPSGNSPNFHITSWNVDGMRAWLKKGGLDILKHDQPEILCLQETKCSLEKIPEEIKEVEGYEAFWCSSNKEGYAGVGVLTKITPIKVVYGILSEEHDDEGRCIALEFEKFHLVNVYVPNAGRKLVTLPKRLNWNEAFKSFVKKLDESKPVIICGDMNVAHEEIDLANPKTNTKNAGFTKEEREGMTDFLKEGYIDTFRELYPNKEKAYTFWTYMSNARTKNVGWRLDYFIVSARFKENICDNVIVSDVLGSDHCPIVLWLHI